MLKRFYDREICLKIIHKMIHKMSDNLKTKELFYDEEFYEESYIKMIEKDPAMIHKIPDNLKTKEFYLKLIKEDGSFIQYIEPMDEDFYIDAVKINPNILCFLPVSKRTKNVYIESLRHSGISINYICEIDEDVINILLETENFGEDFLYKIPEKYKTKELCDIALKYNPKSFEYVPDVYKTRKMCLDVLSKSGSMIHFVPQSLLKYTINNVEVQDTELISTAIKNDPYILIDLMANYNITHELYIDALKNEPSLLKYIPKEIKDVELCNVSVDGNGSMLEYVPKEIQTYDMCIKAVIDNPLMLEYCNNKTLELCIIAASVNSKSLIFVPEEFKTSLKFYSKLFKMNPKTISMIPEEFITQKMCNIAIYNNPSMLNIIPIKYRIDLLCAHSLYHESYDNVLPHIPKDIQTNSLFYNSVKDKLHDLTIVPKDKLIHIIKSHSNIIDDYRYLQELIPNYNMNVFTFGIGMLIGLFWR
jgi:tetratricopeptide (TPR) repeat protein